MYRKTSTLFLLILASLSLSSAITVQLEAQNSQGNTVPANYTITQQGSIVATGQDSLITDLAAEENYTIRQHFELSDKSFNVTFHDLNLTSELSPQMKVVNYTAADPYLVNSEKVYATDVNLPYDTAELSYEKQDRPDRILYCSQFYFSGSSCEDRQLQSLENYDSSFQNSKFRFNTTDFSAYTIGDTAPRLDLSSIEIYNVTGLSSSDQRTEGNLVDTGTNKTFTVLQKSANDYRFDFNIENTGSDNWSISSGDLIEHQGLSTDWTVSDIWYELNGSKDGGEFSLGDVKWDTSSNGVLTADGSQSTMQASYVTEIADSSPETYQHAFNASDIDTSAEVFDRHELRIDRYGDLSVELSTPPNNTILRQNGSFYITGNVSCEIYDCGTVDVTPRYNESGIQVVLPDSSGSPFYLEESAVKQCDLSAGENCSLNWTANATGELESQHLIDINASTSENMTYGSSENNLVEIDTVILMDLAFEVVDFGFLDPGVTEKPAQGNSNDNYSISIDENSKPVEDLWIKGTDLTSVNDPSYEIGASNLSYGLQNNFSDSERLEKNYSRLASDLSPGTNLTTYYWLDVPFGMTQSGYNGTITFKANSTD